MKTAYKIQLSQPTRARNVLLATRLVNDRFPFAYSETYPQFTVQVDTGDACQMQEFERIVYDFGGFASASSMRGASFGSEDVAEKFQRLDAAKANRPAHS